ncbi:MAG TPA: 4'-phosphopantetheinyl transferase superfamily protein, partial [Saprospiraceae bacterium]|nr:4'-phosphopantetheinyl transferase superfamily protein [Saprospiraceae bacterium]
MAIYNFFKTHDDFAIGLWLIEEEENFFYDNMTITPEEQIELQELSKRKKLEWLASRYLLHITLSNEDRYPCVKDLHGKPYLLGLDQYISLSHSRNFVATIFGKAPCGIDIQYHIDKISMIEKKFISQTEMEYIPEVNRLLYLHAFWSAKEAVYKAYGIKGTSLVNDLKIKPFEISIGGTTFMEVVLNKDNLMKKYHCYHSIFEDYTMVYAYEN